MSDEIDREETTLGTALSRAVESQPVRETPFEASRLAASLAARGRSAFWRALAAAATLVVAVGLAAFVLVPRDTPAEPSPSAIVPTPTPAATTTPGPTMALRVFFARDQLPPIGAEVQVPLDVSASAEQRIRERLEALATATGPAGAANALASSRTKPAVRDVTIYRDLARIDWTVPNSDWGVGGTAGQQGLMQQLVYTATEEPGIRRVMFTENGGKPTTVFTGHGLPTETPATREDVFGYAFTGSEVPSIELGGGSQVPQEFVSVSAWNDGASISGFRYDTPGVGRVTIEIRAKSAVPGGRLDPRLRASLTSCDLCGSAKWLIRLDLPDADGPSPAPAFQRFVAGPITSLDVPHTRGTADTGTIFLIGLDDARPWRVSVEPFGTDSARILVDIGGRPQQVNKNIAVYTPQAGAANSGAPRLVVAGAARVFEATVNWRVRDGRGIEVLTGHTLATIGTSPVWGTFDVKIDPPASLSGSVTLEVFWISPRDGSDQDVVEIPLTIR